MRTPRPDTTGPGLALVMGLFAGLSSIGTSGAAVVLPSLAADMGIPTVTSAWVIGGFLAGLRGGDGVLGRLADPAGLRLPLTVGVAVMATGALLAATAPDVGILVVGRLLQGMGGATLPVLGMAVVGRWWTAGSTRSSPGAWPSPQGTGARLDALDAVLVAAAAAGGVLLVRPPPPVPSSRSPARSS